MPGFLDRWRGRKNAPAGASVEQRQQAGALGTTPLADAPDRRLVALAVRIESVEVVEHEGTSWLEALATDGTGQVTLTWMGRREIPGIEVDRRLRVEGRLGMIAGRRRVYNPSYTLL